MIEKFRQFVRPRSRQAPRVPEGERVYAIGDVHGRFDLFVALAWAIESDDKARGAADTTIISLGDLVDRGPDSSLVLHAARDWQKRRKVRIIAGNHEEMFLKSFNKLESLSHFLRFGGFETIVSYGVDPVRLSEAGLSDAQEMMTAAVPEGDIAFLESLEDTVVIGDYLFVHAGIQPGKPLEVQHVQNMRWIREPFLSSTRDFGHVVVHGHTIQDEPVLRPNRIGLDTGAFMSGKLTALGLEGSDQWLLEASERDGRIATSVHPITLAD